MRALAILAPPVSRRYVQNPDQVFCYASLMVHVGSCHRAHYLWVATMAGS